MKIEQLSTEPVLIDNVLLDFIQNNIKDTIFKYEPKNTKYSKKGYIRFVSSYDSVVLYFSKNKIILVNLGSFSFSASKEHKANYKINDKNDFMICLQSVYDYYRFFSEHYPELGMTYSLKNGQKIKKSL